MSSYIIYINKEGSPVLVEVPEKPESCFPQDCKDGEKRTHWIEKETRWVCTCRKMEVDYEVTLQQVLSDTSKHIRFKDEQAVKAEIVSELNLQIAIRGEVSDNYILSDKLPVGQTFPLPSNMSVGFEEVPTTPQDQTSYPSFDKVAVLTDTPKPKEPVEQSVSTLTIKGTSDTTNIPDGTILIDGFGRMYEVKDGKSVQLEPQKEEGKETEAVKVLRWFIDNYSPVKLNAHDLYNIYKESEIRKATK